MAYSNLADLPPGLRAQLDDLRNRWEGLTGYRVDVPDWMLVEMANDPAQGSSLGGPHAGEGGDLYSFGRYMFGHVVTQTLNIPGATIISSEDAAAYPWAFYGMTAEQYQSQGTTYASEYKKVTGQDIPPDELAKAFQSTKDATGGLLSGSEYLTRLQQDANLQKTYGWIKYGLDFQSFQQQKLSMRQQFGRDLTDEEATTQLQYLHSAQGGDHAATAARPQESADQRKQASQGVSGSVIR